MPCSGSAVGRPKLHIGLIRMANFPLLLLWPLFSRLVRSPKNGMKLLLANLASVSFPSPPAWWLLPQPLALPWEPENFLFLSGIEGEDHHFLTADAENSTAFFFFFLTPEYEDPCLQLCDENHIIVSPAVGRLWVKPREARVHPRAFPTSPL